jgi:hypothetical protein
MIVQDVLGLSILISIFNGNMVLPSRQQRFKMFCAGLQRFCFKTPIQSPIHSEALCLTG